MSGKQAVKVIIRTRPTADFAQKNLEIEPSKGDITIKFDKNEKAGLINNQTDAWKFQFEKILHNASQDEVYEASASQIVQSVVEGYNGTVFCYGQTGAGKTYTMTGSQTEFKYRGIVPRAINQIYALTSSKFEQTITIRVSYAEIYNDQIRDLLPDITGVGSENMMMRDQNLQIVEDARGGVLVRGLSQHICHSEEEALNCLFEGELNRTFRNHYLNATSSRAHTIFSMHIESRSRVESADKVVYSKLHLVDLAGSERTKKTKSDSAVLLREAQFINKSLTFLEQVVLALSSTKRDHIPYRQAKLTNFLRDSLGGNCKTVMIANVWPEARHLEETNSTLKFAARMMKITNEATVNIMVDPALQIKRYEKEIRDLKQELAMHDTLSNRGRINYSTYNMQQQADIELITSEFLQGKRENIGDIDSLRKVREVFSCIKNQYRKLHQNIDAIKRQMEANPEAFKQMQEEKERAATADSTKTPAGAESKEEVKEGDEPPADQPEDNATPVPEEKKKREAIDKQIAFVEFKDSEEGQVLQQRISDFRESTKQSRVEIKDLTEQLNHNKKEIDALKGRLDRKEEERKVRMRDEQLRQAEDMFEDAGKEDIIDEEELVLLRQMKDLKKVYRDSFSKLKNLKMGYNENQTQIDMVKQQLIAQFEVWYAQEFEVPGIDLINAYNANLKNELKEGNADSVFGGSAHEDEDQQTFMRAKRKVATLAKAKRDEKRVVGAPVR